MADVTPFSVSQLLSELLGKQIAAALVPPKTPDTKVKKAYGLYTGAPSKRALVVLADLPLLASFAGLLLGLPDATAKERAEEAPMHEGVRDAIHETLNIFSTVLSVEERVIFQRFVLDRVYCDDASSKVLSSPGTTTTFNMAIAGTQAGRLSILTRFD
jgi:hypothetical protein